MTNLADLKHLQGNSLRARVQRFGGNLAAMIMPNIGAFIAWGLITALFIPTGWLPNETLAELVGPMITMLLPLLIGYTGGRLVHGQRGAVVGAVATVGVVVGSEVPMFLGAMIIAPITALLLKGFDRLVDGKIRTGFEMLVNNFSAGIIGGAMALIGLVAIGPVVEALTTAAGNGVDFLVSNSLLPLVSLIVEPAKVLFLNNAINHGVLSPIGLSEAAESGQSLLFMIETNPGPGLGILIAFLFFGPRVTRATVPGAMIIHFLGGIHEIYFPYVLMKPRLILAAIGGGAAGVATAMITNSGLVAVPSPGSIFAYLAVTPRGGYVSVLLSIVVATGVSFLLASMLLRFGRGADDPLGAPVLTADAAPAPARATAAAAAPGAGSRAGTTTMEEPPPSRPVISGKDVTTVLIACDAGMGSSVMLAGQMRNRLKPYGVSVEHVSVNAIPADAQLVLTHADLAPRARATAPNAVVVPFTSFLSDPVFDTVEDAIKEGGELRG
ncbi:PTS mannitol transporter subunit IICB [Prauserella muralis]|uniref:PTS system mannitol-specific EIICB component n=1 Tax=Prauserella muralis TaxID=588067 RepID=A0A2V4AQG3_9PSEU|nr:PTS mannitol transporter subunit IICB [Prauserella muralis]PXY22863.1 PTS mannitol transporter subunit IIBC [Prauserella muralis]TWE28618.1 PTS system mannitol-specific IIC component [Prauserella muralis]